MGPMLLQAVQHGAIDIVQSLLLLGAEVNFVAMDGEGDRTPLDMAVAVGDKLLVDLLLQKGAVNLQQSLRHALDQSTGDIAGQIVEAIAADRHTPGNAGTSLSGLHLRDSLTPELLIAVLQSRMSTTSTSSSTSGPRRTSHTAPPISSQLGARKIYSKVCETIPGMRKPGIGESRKPRKSAMPSLPEKEDDLPSDDGSPSSLAKAGGTPVSPQEEDLSNSAEAKSSDKSTIGSPSIKQGTATPPISTQPESPGDSGNQLERQEHASNDKEGRPSDFDRSATASTSKGSATEASFQSDVNDDVFETPKGASTFSDQGIGLEERPFAETIPRPPRVLYRPRNAIQNLDLSHNAIPSLDNLLSGEQALQPLFECLEEVSLAHNSLESLPPRVLEWLCRLCHLDVSHNKLKSIPRGLLHMKCLTHLTMAKNSISSIDDVIDDIVAESTSSSSILSPSAAAITTDPAPTSPSPFTSPCQSRRQSPAPPHGERFSRVMMLDLSKNSLKTLPPRTSEAFPRLRKLLLQNNELILLRSSASSRFNNLTELNVTGNHLEDLPEAMFWGMRSLEKLKADRNRLR